MIVRSMVSIACMALLTAGLPGCAMPGSPYRGGEPDRRDPRLADQLTRRAVEATTSDPERAERLLRDALAADLYHGPAHNNLGVLLLDDGRLYEAANEFEWARKLMPGHPAPRVNLGIVLERGGSIDEAIEQFEAALLAVPEDLAASQALARCQLRYARTDSRTLDRLRLIAARAGPRWRDWALQQALVLDSDPPAD
ncbi:MAG: tetratricopeptide repeat protein [Planctomycetota bacterium]